MVPRERRQPGGIFRLGRLIAEHPAAVAYDWRTRFGCASEQIGEPGGMSWAEACLLLRVLVTDSGSRVAAAVSGWQQVMSPEVDALLTLHDLVASALTRKPVRSPRPWDRQSPDVERVHHGARSTLPQSVRLDILEAMRTGTAHPLLPEAEPVEPVDK